jgi:tetratricopeptide (TPR) repeat protein
MKKKFLSILLPVIFLVAVGFVVIRYKNNKASAESNLYVLLPRKNSNNQPEWLAAKKNADRLIAKIKANPGDTRSALALANAYITEGRISGNIAYYDKAALQTVNRLLAKDPVDYEALMIKALVQLSQHHFAEGLATAKQSLAIDSNSAFIYGLLVDANVEMGDYAAALAAADKMVSLRPDLRSYSRIAYLREIHGDYAGAASAMKLAVAAGMPADEPTEWCRIQLGRLYEKMGEVDKALFQYHISLAARPGYAYALAGLGGIAAHQKKYDSAVTCYEQAAMGITDPGIKQKLAFAYQQAGKTSKAKEMNKEVEALMMSDQQKSTAVDDPEEGHYSDKEMAYLYLQTGDNEKALQHAMTEYKRRPKNIDVNETMARVYYKRNEAIKALPFVEAALVTGSRNPELLCIAGMIYLKTGDAEKSKKVLALALNNNPVIAEDIRAEAESLFGK